MLLEQVLAELCIEDADVEGSIEDVEIEKNLKPCIEDRYVEENEDPVELDAELLPSSPFRAHAAVPFLWEEIPGKPKKNFRNDPSPLSDPPHIKVAAAASVPFKWEEKPGLPKVLPKQGPYLSLTLPPHRQKIPLSHMGAAAAGTNSAKGQPSKLKDIFPTRLVELIKPSAPPKYIEKSEANEARELVLSPCKGSDGDDEMFELDLSAFAFNGVRESHSSRRETVSELSKFSELRSSRGGRSSDSAPALLANCLLTMMEMSQAVPVEDISEPNMALPLLVSVAGSKDDGGADILDNHKTHPNNSSEYYLERQSFDSIQTASPHGGGRSPHREASPIVAWNESDSLESIRWGERDLISSDEVSRISPIDTPCLELGIASELEKNQVKTNDMNRYDSCSSPMGSTFVFVAGGTSGSSTLPSHVKISASSVQGANSISGLDTAASGTGPESASSSESNDCFAKNIGSPGNDSSSSSESNDCFAKDIGPPGNDSGSNSESNAYFAKTNGHPVSDPSHFQQGSSLDAEMEETVPVVFGADFQKHSRKPSFSARKLALCMEMRRSMINCCSPGPTPSVHCSRGGIPTAHTISCFKTGDNHIPNCLKAGDNYIPNCSILSCHGGKWIKHENSENSYPTSDGMGQYRPPRPHSE